MFLNHRSRRIAALIVTVFLLAALPAAAGGAAPRMRAARGADTAWEGLVTRVLAWLASPWDGDLSAASTDSGSQIDPLGLTYKAISRLNPHSWKVDLNGSR
jgi:hypothetical protein